MYHAVIDITGSNVEIGDEVLLNIPPICLSNKVKREYN